MLRWCKCVCVWERDTNCFTPSIQFSLFLITLVCISFSLCVRFHFAARICFPKKNSNRIRKKFEFCAWTSNRYTHAHRTNMIGGNNRSIQNQFINNNEKKHTLIQKKCGNCMDGHRLDIHVSNDRIFKIKIRKFLNKTKKV